MRAREFLNEANGEMHPYTEKQVANIMVMPELDQFYEFYRFMTAVAMAPDHDPTTETDLANMPAAYAYTKADEEKLRHGLKILGKKGKWMTSGEASEPKDTGVHSPVAKVKKNKYGV